MKLNRITLIEATLELKTGLHIGAGDTEMHIGGIYCFAGQVTNRSLILQNNKFRIICIM